MVRVSSSEFAKNFGRYKEIAQREPVEITSHDRPSGYLISEAEFTAFAQFKKNQPVAISIYDLPPDDLEALMTTKMDPRHNHLNALLDD